MTNRTNAGETIMNDKEKEAQINQILNIIKIASLSFPAIAFLQYYSVNFSDMKFFLESGMLIAAVLAAILLIYILWTHLQSRISDHFRYKNWIDPVVSLSIAFLSVMLTGSYASNYKFLFLFVIISSGIELSRRESMIVSSLSAATILSIDLFFAPKTSVNTYFESDIVLACVFLLISWTISYYVDLRKNTIRT